MTSDNNGVYDWLTLLMTPGVGAASCRRLLEYFGSPTELLAAPAKDIAALPGFGWTQARKIQNASVRREAEQELAHCNKLGITLIPQDHRQFPDNLRQLPDPPLLLYCKGDLGLLNSPCFAIVGARAATTYGSQMATRFAAELSQAGLTIVSGLALGIDTAAHSGCLRAGGKTIGVLGCGLDIIYPAANRALFQTMGEKGLLLSEYPLSTRPDGFRFPARNRIISGLATGVLVVEAAKKSGSLITADLALDQGKEIFAIPGRIDSCKSAGTHKIVQQGAKLVHCLDDILEELPAWTTNMPVTRPKSHSEEIARLPMAEQKLLALMDAYPQEIDTIIRTSGNSPQEINALLLRLELQGYVESLPGRQYRRKSIG